MARSSHSVPLRVGPQGRIVVPAEMRRELGIEPGEAPMVRVEERTLVLERRAEILERLRSELRGVRPKGGSAVDGLIAGRWAEARREAAEHARCA